MVTIQTGSDISVATRNWTAPTTTTTTTTTTTLKGASTTTTTTISVPTTVYDPPGVKTDNNLSAPSFTAQPLEPWDPRACSPGMPVMVDRSKS
jgi:Tfp pilus assembly major pilin PilA